MIIFNAPMVKRLLTVTVAIGCIVAFCTGISTAVEPDAIYYNGKIATLDAAGSTVQAVAVKDGKFLNVGGTEEIKQLAGKSTRMVDLGGKTVVPGLIDAHTHPMETIMMKDGWVDARYPACPSVKQALVDIAAWIQRTPKEKWVFVACVSASENKFIEKRLPTKAELDKVAPDNPVVVADGAHFEPLEAVTVMEALKMWTIWAAKSIGEENMKGSIEPGKYADMAVLSNDIFTMPKDGLKDVIVLKTILGGKVVYETK